MRLIRMVFLLLSLIILVAEISLAKSENPFEEKLPFKTATITYAITGMENGTEMLYIDEYGQKRATYHKTMTKMMGMAMENSTIEITDADWVYVFDMVEGTGTKSSNPEKFLQEEFDKLSAAEKEQVMKNRDLMGAGVMSGMGGQIEKNAMEILGHSCDKASIMGTTAYSIHNTTIMLKSEANVMGMKMDVVATAIDEGKVDEKVFSFPEGIEVMHDQQVDMMSQQMAQQTMEWLKDPEAVNNAPQMGAMNMDRMEDIPEADQEMMKQAQEMMKGFQGALGN